MKKQINEILESMTNRQLMAIYLSLDHGSGLQQKARRIIETRGYTIKSIRKYHSLY